MGKYVAVLAIALLTRTAVRAWPTNGQLPQTLSWPWAAASESESEKPFELPKSPAFQIQGQQLMGEGPGVPKWNPHQQSPWNQHSGNAQGLGSDPWSSMQTNSPFDSDDLDSQQPFDLFGGDNKPYGGLYPQTQHPYGPVMPNSMFGQNSAFGPASMGGFGGHTPPRVPMMGMSMGGLMGGGQHPMMAHPPPPHHHQMAGHTGNSQPFDWPRAAGRGRQLDTAPSPMLRFLGLRSFPNQASMRFQNGTIPAITVQYNITYAFSPWGWKTSDVIVADASFHTAEPEESGDISAPGGGVTSQVDSVNEPDMATRYDSWWWPKKTGSEVEAKALSGGQRDLAGFEPAGFGRGSSFPNQAPPQ